MKKRTFLLALLIASLTLSGCNREEKPVSDTEFKEEVMDKETETTVSISSAQNTTAVEDEKQPEDDSLVAKVEEPTYFYSDIDNSISFMSEASIESVRFSEFEYVIGAGDGYAFFTYFEDEIRHLAAFDLKDKTKKDILTDCDYGIWVDVYENILYVTNYSYPAGKYIERAFSMDTFEELDNNQLFYDRISDYNLYTYKLNSAGSKACLKRIMDNAGYVLLSKDHIIYRCVNDEIFQLSVMPDNYDVWYYDMDYIVSTTGMLYDDNPTSLNVYCNQTAENSFVAGDIGHYLGFDGATVYYSMEDKSEYGRTIFDICSKNLATKESCVLTSLQKNPGVYLPYPGVEGFTVYADYLYFLADDGKDIGWYFVPKTMTKEPYEASPTAMVIKESSFKDLGHVEALSETYYCNKCGEPLLKYYDEYFVVDVPVSEYANKINDDMKAAATRGLEENIQDIRNIEANDCADHSEVYDHITMDDNIESAYFISPSIFVINSNGYWYSGGAHGMPFNGHILYDINTGERLHFSDLYKGTEEDLKNIVATRVKEDFEAYDAIGYGSPYYASTSEEAYEDAFGVVSIEYLSATYTEKGMMVEFDPYVLGPFAAGWITVFVSYEELGITLY